MGRVSSRYNYRLSKNGKKAEVKNRNKKLISPDKIVIRKKKEKNPVKDIPVRVKKFQSVATKKNKVNSSLKKAVKNVSVKSVVKLADFKDYCNKKRVILVGNAIDIIKNKYGSQIDSYDVVIRMNHGHPIKKYAVNMGQKYNIWAHGFLNHKHQIKEYNSIKNRIDYHIETSEAKLCKRIFDKKAFLISKKWYKNAYEKKYNGKEMSTGLNIATFFIKWVGTMSEVTIVGFDFLKTTNRVLISASARKFHDKDAEEKEMVKMLNECGKYVPFNEKYNFAK